MADLNRLERDLGFVRDALSGTAPRSPARIYFLWAVIVLAGFTLIDLRPDWVGAYWMTLAPLGGVLSAYIGWRDQRQQGQMDSALGMQYVQHWGAMMCAIFLAVLMVRRGLMTGAAMGPTALLFLAVGYFHAGLYLDPPLRWIGILMVAGYLAVLTIDTYAWTMVGVAVATAMMLLGLRESRRRVVAPA